MLRLLQLWLQERPVFTRPLTVQRELYKSLMIYWTKFPSFKLESQLVQAEEMKRKGQITLCLFKNKQTPACFLTYWAQHLTHGSEPTLHHCCRQCWLQNSVYGLVLICLSFNWVFRNEVVPCCAHLYRHSVNILPFPCLPVVAAWSEVRMLVPACFSFLTAYQGVCGVSTDFHSTWQRQSVLYCSPQSVVGLFTGLAYKNTHTKWVKIHFLTISDHNKDPSGLERKGK